MSGRPWTGLEDMALRELWPLHGRHWNRWGEALPGRTPAAIADRAQRLGLRKRGTVAPAPRVREHPRIREVLDLLGDGLPPSAIDARLGLEPGTARRAISTRWRMTRSKEERS